MIYKEPLESPERLSDQSALPNLNATWVNAKGRSNLPGDDSTGAKRSKSRLLVDSQAYKMLTMYWLQAHGSFILS